jgi:hypothetical protein
MFIYIYKYFDGQIIFKDTLKRGFGDLIHSINNLGLKSYNICACIKIIVSYFKIGFDAVYLN